ncbi:PCC domain-containing protein [Nocardiopsis nanhaiensis]
MIQFRDGTEQPRREALDHPGPRAADRLTSVSAHTFARRVRLPAGKRLLDALAEVVDAVGCTSAQAEIMGGTLDRVSYSTPDAAASSSSAVGFSPVKEAVAPAQLVTASATLGHREGRRFMHCHAAWLDSEGELHAGHLWPETTVGAVPVHAVVHLLPGVDLVSEEDPETGMPVFTPRTGTHHSVVGSADPTARAVLSRVRPGEEITGAVEEVCRRHGFDLAVVHASLGSLIGADLHRRDGLVYVDGPATEVVNATGTLRATDCGGFDGELSTVLVDRHGAVHAGRLARGRNLVAVTFELLVTEETPGGEHG